MSAVAEHLEFLYRASSSRLNPTQYAAAKRLRAGGLRPAAAVERARGGASIPVMYSADSPPIRSEGDAVARHARDLGMADYLLDRARRLQHEQRLDPRTACAEAMAQSQEEWNVRMYEAQRSAAQTDPTKPPDQQGDVATEHWRAVVKAYGEEAGLTPEQIELACRLREERGLTPQEAVAKAAKADSVDTFNPTQYEHRPAGGSGFEMTGEQLSRVLAYQSQHENVTYYEAVYRVLGVKDPDLLNG